MPRPESFDQLRRELEALEERGAAVQLFEEVADAAASWTAAVCGEWLVPLAQALEDGGTLRDLQVFLHADEIAEGDSTADDVLDAAIHLVEVVINRLHDQRGTLPAKEIDRFIRDLSAYPITLDLPRRYLVDAYPWWIDDYCIPAVAEYAHQVADKATPEDKIGLTRKVLEDKEHQAYDYAAMWIGFALPAAWDVEPELVRTLLDELREICGSDPDPLDDALIQHHERLLNRVKDPQAPRAVAEFATSPFDASSARAALESLTTDAGRDVSVGSGLLIAIIARELEVIEPTLPRYVHEATCESSRCSLLAFRRLEQLQGLDPTVGCSLLTLALEEQLRWALSRGLTEDGGRLIGEQGLAALARFATGGFISSLSDMVELDVHVDAQEHSQFLRKAGGIRNKIHHRERPIRTIDLETLRRAVFDSDPRALRIMTAIERIRARPR